MSGNGVDLGSIYGLLALVAETVARLDRDSATKREVADVKDSVASLRQAVTGYHASVMGHGILTSELDERVRRIERRLDMGAAT